MIKIYALFDEALANEELVDEKEPGTGPFKLDSGAARAAITKRFPGLRHYRQFLRAPEQLAGLPVAPYLGSAELWLDDDADADPDPNSDPAPILSSLASASTTLAEMFSRDPVMLIRSQEHNISGEPWHDSGFKATFLFGRKDSMALTDFHDYWLNHHGPIAALTQDAERYVQSHIDEPGRTYDGITELFWADHPTALASMGSEQMTVDQSNDAQNFVAGESLVVVMEQETP